MATTTCSAVRRPAVVIDLVPPTTPAVAGSSRSAVTVTPSTSGASKLAG